MKYLKKLIFFAPLLAVIAFSGCMTPQVKLRLEYDKLTKAITSAEDKKEDYLACAGSDTAKAVLGYIWDKTDAAKKQMMAVYSSAKYAKVNVMTFGFKVENVSATEKNANVHFLMTVTLTDEDWNTLKDADNKDITSLVYLFETDPSAPPAPAVINLHKYKISADSEESIVYNLIFNYVKNDGEWKINGIKDSNDDKTLKPEELAAMFA